MPPFPSLPIPYRAHIFHLLLRRRNLGSFHTSTLLCLHPYSDISLLIIVAAILFLLPPYMTFDFRLFPFASLLLLPFAFAIIPRKYSRIIAEESFEGDP